MKEFISGSLRRQAVVEIRDARAAGQTVTDKDKPLETALDLAFARAMRAYKDNAAESAQVRRSQTTLRLDACGMRSETRDAIYKECFE